MSKPRRLTAFLVAGMLVTLLLAGVVSSFASSSPDGLERVAIDKGFDETATDHPFAGGPAADYSVRGVDNERMSTAVAGVLGVAVTFLVAGGAVVLIRKVRRNATVPAS